MRDGREDEHSEAFLFALRLSTAAALALLATADAADAQALRDKWCSDVHLRFFVGGAEGDAFGTIVYNGAKQAAADTGAQVDYVFSGWERRDDGPAASRGRRAAARTASP